MMSLEESYRQVTHFVPVSEVLPTTSVETRIDLIVGLESICGVA